MFDTKQIVGTEAVLMCTRNQCFEQTYQKYQNCSMENFKFYRSKNLCTLHGRVLVMILLLYKRVVNFCAMLYVVLSIPPEVLVVVLNSAVFIYSYCLFY